MRTLAYIQPAPLFPLWLAADQGCLTRISFVELPPEPDQVRDDAHPLLAEAARQLGEYFAAVRTRFELPLALDGTPFQRRVWDALLQIPYGATRSYAELARGIGAPAAARAAGSANGANPIPIVVPCHRVIASGGGLGGYGGGLDRKQFLLALERRASIAASNASS
jgi:methylated-DNA-[protein]-cysteine S-methyltransferase